MQRKGLPPTRRQVQRQLGHRAQRGGRPRRPGLASGLGSRSSALRPSAVGGSAGHLADPLEAVISVEPGQQLPITGSRCVSTSRQKHSARSRAIPSTSSSSFPNLGHWLSRRCRRISRPEKIGGQRLAQVCQRQPALLVNRPLDRGQRISGGRETPCVAVVVNVPRPP